MLLKHTNPLAQQNSQHGLLRSTKNGRWRKFKLNVKVAFRTQFKRLKQRARKQKIDHFIAIVGYSKDWESGHQQKLG